MNPPDQREVEVSVEAIKLAKKARAEAHLAWLSGPEEMITEEVTDSWERAALQAAAPVLCAQERERLEAEQREGRLERLLGKDWPAEVVLMRDAGAKSSPPWTWWMEGREYDHDKYEAHTYVPVEAVQQAAQQERERLINDPVQVGLCHHCGLADDPRRGSCSNCGGQLQHLSRSLVELARQQERERVKEALESVPRLAISPNGNVLERPGVGAFVRYSDLLTELDRND